MIPLTKAFQEFKRRENYKSEILKGMPYEEITEEFIQGLSNKDLNSMHYTSHKFYTYSCRRAHFKKYLSLIEERHGWIVKEMIKRGLNHNSPLTCKERNNARYKYYNRT